MSKRLAFLLLLLAGASGTVAAAATAPVVAGEQLTLHSELLGEDRVLRVYTPADYDKSGRKYPLALVLDGYFLWSSATVDYLAFSGNVPPTVVVALDSTDRDRDFTPTRARNIEGEDVPQSGGARRFLDFLEKELIPYLEKRYRLQPHRLIAGHSLGGLFVAYAMLESPDLFQAYLAISPTLPWDNEWVRRQIGLRPPEKTPRHRFFFLAMDSQSGSMATAARRYTETLRRHNPALRLRSVRYPDEDHISCFLRGFYDGLRALYAQYKISEALIEKGDAPGIAAHYESLTDQFGYRILPDAGWLEWVANWHRLMKRTREAAALLELAVDYYPQSVDTRLALAQVLAEKGEVPQALEALERARGLSPTAEQVQNIDSLRDKVQAARPASASKP